MAKIKLCAVCGKTVSRSAMKCTHCGRPMFSYWLALLVLMAILLVLACGVVEVITRIRGR